MKKRGLKLFLGFVLGFVMLVPMLGCGGRTFTEEEHIQRITERVQI